LTSNHSFFERNYLIGKQFRSENEGIVPLFSYENEGMLPADVGLARLAFSS